MRRRGNWNRTCRSAPTNRIDRPAFRLQPRQSERWVGVPCASSGNSRVPQPVYVALPVSIRTELAQLLEPRAVRLRESLFKPATACASATACAHSIEHDGAADPNIPTALETICYSAGLDQDSAHRTPPLPQTAGAHLSACDHASDPFRERRRSQDNRKLRPKLALQPKKSPSAGQDIRPTPNV